jgi:hypothetical protein
MIRVRKKPEEMVLNELKGQLAGYEKAEITLLIAEKTHSNEFFNLLTLIELVPTEQADSLPFGKGDYPHVIRGNSDEHTFYAIRLTGLTVAEVIDHYASAATGLDLNHKGVKVKVSFRGALTENPPAAQPLLIASGERQIGRLLPHRHTNFRVWSQLNMDKDWLKDLDKSFFRELARLSQKLLGYDLSLIPEHIGNIYLFGCNPLLRSWDMRLIDFEKDLFLRFNERMGQTVKDCKLVLEEVRGDNNGFYIEQLIGAPDIRIALPYLVDRMHVRLIDSAGRWIEHSLSRWANFSFQIAIQESPVTYEIKTAGGTQVFSVAKKTVERGARSEPFDWTAAHYLRDALAQRRFQDLAENKEFIFFPKDPDSPRKAKEAVRELLNSAQERCMILDPYFGAADLVYAYHIENISLTVQIISSAHHLNERPRIDPPPVLTGWRGRWQRLHRRWQKKRVLLPKTYLEQLHEEIQRYRQAYPLQKIDCRILRGSPSPLHDRFIVVDDRVYLLGSSLNEFGNRTTTIIKVPAPDELIRQAQTWWEDEEHCPAISDYVKERGSHV